MLNYNADCMSPDFETASSQEKVIFTTQAEKFGYFRKKASENPGDPHYESVFEQIKKDIFAAGIEGESGVHYEDGDIVESGELMGLEKGKAIPKGFVTVFRIETLSEYLRDGVPVEMVHRSVVRTL